MTSEEAASLEQFIKDHDTRYAPKAMTDGESPYVLLKRPGDGGEFEVHSVEEYGSKYIEGHSPGPTISAAWEKWRSRGAGQA